MLVICWKIPPVFCICFSKFPTQVSSLWEEPLTSPVTIVLMPRCYQLSTHCSIGYYFHTTTGNKQYSKTWLLTKLTLNSGIALYFICIDDSTMNCQCSVYLLLFRILLIFACVFWFKYFYMHIPAQHCRLEQYTSLPLPKCIDHRLHIFYSIYM